MHWLALSPIHPPLGDFQFMFWENLLLKYKALKNKSSKLKEENENLFSKLNMILQERAEISSERDSLKTQLDLVLKENENLKNKNDCDDVWRKMRFYLQNLKLF